MQLINEIFGYPLGFIMWLCYLVVRNYAVALLLFTIITKLALFPLSLKQQKSMVKMKLFQPKVEELQKKYAKNKEKLNEETMKLYQEEGYNPMSGCLPSLIQFPLLFGIIDVVYRPLTHIAHISRDLINQAMEIVTNLGLAANTSSYYREIHILSAVRDNPEAFSSLGQEFIDKAGSINLSFFGLDLTATPQLIPETVTLTWALMLIIPLLSGLTSLFYSILTMRQNKKMDGDKPQAGGGMMKGMMLLMPVLSFWFAFSFPLGVSLYWLFSNVLMIVQQLVMNKVFDPEKEAEKLRQKMEEEKEKKRQERLAARQNVKKLSDTGFQGALKKAVNSRLASEGGQDGEEAADDGEPTVSPEVMQKALSAKEINRAKLAAARKRDAEKYGEEYVEVTDDDLS